MAVQLPSEASGVVAGVLVYSFFCLACGLFLLWLVWVHNERKSYVAMLGFFTSLTVAASIAQQLHTIVRWHDVKTAEHNNIVANVGNPELNITGGATGVDRVLFYIQYYGYNVESMLVFFWAFELANSIFQLRMTKTYRFHASLAAKTIAAILPAVQMILLRFSAVQSSTVAFMIVADGIMVFCFAAGSFILFAILARYLHSRITLASWIVPYGEPSAGSSGRNSTPRPRLPPRGNIYDNWLVVRFTIAFIAMSLFQIVVINFQLRAAGSNNRDNIATEPDLSASRVAGDFALFTPGVTAAVLVFLVFGTTRTFRQYMWALLVPSPLRRRWESRMAARKGRKASVSVSGLGSALGSVPARRGADEDEEAAGGGGEVVMVGLRDLGKRDGCGDGVSDEWPIMKTNSPGLSSPPPSAWRRDGEGRRDEWPVWTPNQTGLSPPPVRR